MAITKRSHDSAEESLDQNDGPSNKISPKREKKARKEKTDEEEKKDVGGSTSVVPQSLKPMERLKKRKAMVKERNLARLNSMEANKIRELSKGPDTPQIPLPSSGLPELHVSVFRDLTSADSSVRGAAAEKLVRELHDVQKAYEKLGKKEVNVDEAQLEAEKDDDLKDCAHSLRYAIRRLIRGVSSSRECARQGFALGLTIIVDTIASIKVDSLMKLIVNILEVSSSMKGQEARDCLLGRLFAYGALARSGRISDEWISDNSTSTVKTFVSHVISLASKKCYLREPAVAVILELIGKLPVDALLSQVLEAPGMYDWFQSATKIGNPDALLLALKIREKISVDSETFCKLLPSPYSADSLFSVDHLSFLSSCFKESTFCQPRVHGLWPVLVNMIVPDVLLQEEDISSGSNSSKKHKRSRKSSSSEEDISKNLCCFCEVVIEGCLLTSSHDRKHLAFDVLLLLFPRLPASCIHTVLSHKLIHCFMDILSTNDSWLYKAAQFFLREVSNSVRNDDDRRLAVVVSLLKHSNGRFDCVTRTHTVKDLVADFKTGSGCMLFVQSLMNMFVDEGRPEDEPSDQSQTTDENSEMGSSEDKDSPRTSGNPDFLKNWVIDSLPRVLKNLRQDFEAKSWAQKEIMKFLVVQGLFSASLGTEVTSFELQEKFKWPKAATSTALCKMCIVQLQSLLADAQRGEGSRAVSNSLEPNDLGSYFIRFLSTLCNIPSVSLFRPLSNEDEKAFKKLQAMETQLSREEWNSGPGADANKVHALRYLLIQLLLQVLLRPGEFSEAASELVICCKKAFAAPALLDSSGEEDEFDANVTPELMDVLVDTLLSLLPQSSAPMCFAVEQVFRFFCDDITDAALLRMLRVVKKDLKPARHQPTDSGDEGDDDEDFLGIEEAEADEADAIETGDGDDHGDYTEEMPKAEPIAEEHPVSDDSDGGMDDDAMFRMDSYLAQMFKERKNSMGNETAHSQLVLFKLRVLSLLEIYLQRNPGKPKVLTIFSYLAQAFVNAHMGGSEQLGQRIGGILQKKILKAKEYPKGEEIELSILESLLEKSLKSASRARHKLVASLAQSSTFWILKIIQARNFTKKELRRVMEIFQHVLADFFDSKKCRLKAGFVKEVFRRYSWVARPLFGFLLERCGSTKSEFKQVEALDLVNGVLKSCIPGTGDSEKDRSSALKFWKAHLSSLCDLIQLLLSKQPEKQSRRVEVRRFCTKTLDTILLLKLDKPFIEVLKPDAYAACESQLGDSFLPFKKLGK